jgi:hypothetical protein
VSYSLESIQKLANDQVFDMFTQSIRSELSAAILSCSVPIIYNSNKEPSN